MKKKLYSIITLLIYGIAHSDSQIITEVSALEFAKLNPQAQVLQCTKNYPFNFKPYPLYQEYAQEKFPNQGLYQDIYIAKIPNGIAHFCSCNNFWGINGLIFVNNYFIKECQIKDISPFYIHKTKTIQVQKSTNNYYIDGSIAICSHLYSDFYGHFLQDVLGQLALLEIYNIEYDYLCIPYNKKFIEEILELWGIKKEKIIPLEFNKTIQAKTIILPTSITQTDHIFSHANYNHDFIIQYIQQKLVSNAKKIHPNFSTNCKKIFISRKDSTRNNRRVTPNEDEIFNIFKQHGFESYDFTKLNFAEKILLLNNAEQVTSFIGSGTINIIFCKPKTKYIELLQQGFEAGNFFLTNILDLDYYVINNSTIHDFLRHDANAPARHFPIKIIEDFFKNHSEMT